MAETEKKPEKKVHDVKPEQVKAGDVMAFVYFVKVAAVEDGGKRLTVEGLSKGAPPRFQVDGAGLVVGGLSADQFHETVMVSMTEAAQTLSESYNTPLTVCFTKQNGEERVLRGRFLGVEPLLGYSWVEDLDKPDGDRVREVNHRTVKWLIVRGVKYQVKGRK